MSILRFASVAREIGTFVILDEVQAAVAVGDRIGLVGPNGAGKTTLLRLAAGRDEPDRGTVVRKRGLSIGLLAQEAHFDAAFMAAPKVRLRPAELAATRARMPSLRAVESCAIVIDFIKAAGVQYRVTRLAGVKHSRLRRHLR